MAPSATRVGRATASAAASLTLCGILAGLSFDSGGYFPASYTLAAAIGFTIIAAVLLISPPRRALDATALTALAGLSGLAAWAGLSSEWSPLPDTAIEDMLRTLLYVALFVLAVLATASGRYSRQLAWLLLGTILLVVGEGLLTRLIPELIHTTQGSPAVATYRLSGPIGYWNAFGALSSVGVVLAAGLAAAHCPWGLVPRVLAATASVPMVVAAYLSFSRGAWLAVLVGFGVLMVASVPRARFLATALAVGGPAALAVVLVAGYPALTVDPAAGAGAVDAGARYWPQLLACAMGAGVLQALAAWLERRLKPTDQARTVGRWGLVAAAAVVVLAATVTYATSSSAVEGNANAGAQFVERQWRDFLDPAEVVTAGGARLLTVKGTRSDLYRVALEEFAAHPVRGEGSGAFQVRYTRDRHFEQQARDAHSLYLETLGELGVVGFLLLALAVGAIAVAGVRACRRPRVLARAEAAAVAAAVAALFGHAAIDWDWQVPAVTGSGLALAACLFPRGKQRRRKNGGEGTVSGRRGGRRRRRR